MLGISIEHIVILIVILLIFGPGRLPDLGQRIGKAVKNFKDGFSGIQEASYRKLDEDPKRKNASDEAPKETVAKKDDPNSDEKA